MAQDSETPTAADKGKGKAVEKPEDAKKDKEPVINGKKDDDKDECSFATMSMVWVSRANSLIAATEELSEEDQQLKNELDMLVERLTVHQPHIALIAFANTWPPRSRTPRFTSQHLKR